MVYFVFGHCREGLLTLFGGRRAEKKGRHWESNPGPLASFLISQSENRNPLDHVGPVIIETESCLINTDSEDRRGVGR
jgi:hypothetical protein